MSRLQAELFERCTFASATHLHCAVSGGADSLALLVLACASGLEVTAIHVDHGLRPDSSADADVVAAAAARFGARFESRTVHIDPGPNTEARARAARYGVLPPDVLTGHTADDQAETIVLNLLRGAGLDGLGGMRPNRRPLLHLRRAETHALCNELGLQPVRDPSNADPLFRRNRVRHELLPLMNDIAGRDVAAVIARQADSLHAIADLLDAQAAALDPTDAKELAAAPAPLATRAIRQWLRAITDSEAHPPDSGAVHRVLNVAKGNAIGCDVVNGIRVVRSQQRLRVEFAGPSGLSLPPLT